MVPLPELKIANNNLENTVYSTLSMTSITLQFIRVNGFQGENLAQLLLFVL